ncbi:MAG: bifunctional diaminohydroxyphosphoribosylaminopyrimidine deaminase/5-amino-6-(5-phosphoribosylamino)uracil reductase RibD, partial [Verrucomicrobiae bacterium]|nr:bifunctional diaminohydroxyphosphoribosylaminopyrimidine deaminase/5-amino-6-(5-phosphoribosylamino)uracil reductase RibD [Verrucomicrobiae bacterium]
VVVGTVDPNPRHLGRGIDLLRKAGVAVSVGCLRHRAEQLNEAWNHWIQEHRPWVIVKAAMTLDGKIATRNRESKWITGPAARSWAMRLRRGVDAILVGVNTVLADNPSLTPRRPDGQLLPPATRLPRRIILDTYARTPLSANVVADEHRRATIIVVGEQAPIHRVNKLMEQVTVWRGPAKNGLVDIEWLLKHLGEQEITSLLVEGGGEVNASFLLGGFAQRVVFFYAPLILGDRKGIKAVAGTGAKSWSEITRLTCTTWRRLGHDLLLTAKVSY